MGQVVLADEINRATPRTQSALLEAMQERQVTVDGCHASAAAPLPGAGDAEPDRAGGHLPAAGGAARPLPAAGEASATRRRRKRTRSWSASALADPLLGLQARSPRPRRCWRRRQARRAIRVERSVREYIDRHRQPPRASTPRSRWAPARAPRLGIYQACPGLGGHRRARLRPAGRCQAHGAGRAHPPPDDRPPGAAARPAARRAGGGHHRAGAGSRRGVGWSAVLDPIGRSCWRCWATSWRSAPLLLLAGLLAIGYAIAGRAEPRFAGRSMRLHPPVVRPGAPSPASRLPATLQVENRRRLPLIWLTTTDRWPNAVVPEDSRDLAPSHILRTNSSSDAGSALRGRLGLRREYTFPTRRRRGIYTLGPAQRAAWIPFALFHAVGEVAAAERLVVYPPLRTLPELGVRSEDPFGIAPGAAALVRRPEPADGHARLRAGRRLPGYPLAGHGPHRAACRRVSTSPSPARTWSCVSTPPRTIATGKATTRSAPKRWWRSRPRW